MAWIQTRKGGAFDLFDPKPEQFDVEEVAHSLAIQTRYNGHTLRPYSVGEHSLLVVEILERAGHPRDVRLAGLMHDAAEAYVGDVVRPLKVQLAQFCWVEGRIGRAAAERFGYMWPLPDAVHWADAAALGVERAHVLAPSARDWEVDLPECDSELPQHAPRWEAVCDMFLVLFDELGGCR